ncbi:TerD family protein [Streptomyces sp. ISL-36]|uniref:TerD family protein n=1 Tax=Streptomyces sp. ISL-36 TaxID=2819182 RepID=UPI001BE5D73D|nr:TerD family protein [Streptomyces sp. ISL-36]MBT2442126.1 TerD family protein [Streptomyces sp. ISL-36]
MTQIIKGGNLPLSGEPMRVAVVRRSGGPEEPQIDAAALLVAADGKVRGREDLVFYNQPEHAGSGVRLTGSAHGEDGVVADWLEIDPGRVEPDVERIVVAASCDGATFGEVTGLYLRVVSAATGEQLALYAVEDATTETALLLGEVYRRGGGWKFRALGQGYASGLPRLAADFGFSVPGDDTTDDGIPVGHLPEPVVAPEPVPVPVPVPVAEPVAVASPETAPAPVPAPAPLVVAKTDGLGHLVMPPFGVPLARCNDLPSEVGPEFTPLEFSGRGKEDIDPGLSLPKGFVVVDVLKEDDRLIEVVTLTVRRRPWRQALISAIPQLRGVGVFHHDGHTPLRLRVDGWGQGSWTIRLRPVSTLRSFDGPVEGVGPDVLAYTGGETGVRYRCLGDEKKEGFFGVNVLRRGGQQQSAFCRLDRGRGSGALPAGPRLLVVDTKGGWSMEPRQGGIGGFWTRRR